jgi:type IX secretion system PorP/SprF family membrane protein
MKLFMPYFKIQISFIIIFFTQSISAQQESNFSIYSGDSYLFNPAASGLDQVGTINLGTRLQWLAANGNPTTIYATIQGQIRKSDDENALIDFNPERKKKFQNNERQFGITKHAAGVKLINDRIGPFVKTNVQGSYSYHLPLTKKLNISVGLALGLTNLGIDSKKVRVDNQTDDVYKEFLTNSNQLNMLDASAGVTIYGRNLFVGMSNTQLFSNKFKSDNYISANGLKRHWNLQFSYLLKQNDIITIEPMLMFRKVKGAPLSADFAAKIHYKQMYNIGLMFRTGNTIGFFAGANFSKNFTFSYCYEHYFSGRKSSIRNTNELKLTYIFGSKHNTIKESIDQKEKNDDELKLPGEK